MTQEELFTNLKVGRTMEELFHFTSGQGCLIYKEDTFISGEQIIYIPDTALNDIPMDKPLTDCEEIRRIAGLCYTGADFMECCGRDKELALALFDYCDWQHPSSALPEITNDGEELEESQEKGQRRILQTLPCEMVLPNGTKLRATMLGDSNYPAITISLPDSKGSEEQLCFVEYNPEKEPGHELCIGVYCSGKDEPVYYDSYNLNDL